MPTKRKKQNRAFVLALVFALIVCAVPEPVFAQHQAKVWRVEQYSKLQGQQTVWIERDAVKIVNDAKRVNILIKAPSRKVYVWSSESKLMHVSEIGKWQGLHEAWSNHMIEQQFVGLEPEHTATGKVLNLLTRKITYLPTKNADKEISALKATYWVTADFALTEPIYRCIELYYGVPIEKGFPLQCVRVGKHSGTRTILQTNKCTIVQADEDLFKPPANLKETRTEAEIPFGNKSKLIEGLLDIDPR